MKLYLVRHGQSIGNVNKIHQHADTPLSKLGISQANELAKRFKPIPLDLVLTSHFKRAQSTAEIVVKHVGVKLEINELLREIKRPSALEGKPTMDPVAVEIRAQIRANLHDSLWHHSDEENIHELINRAKEFLEYISNRKEENILAVSHGIFIGAVLGNVIFEDLLNPGIYKAMEGSMHLTNTGITLLERVDNKWHLQTWNDNAHLGNL